MLKKLSDLIKLFRYRFFGYRRTFFYLLRKRGIRAAWNFFYSKGFIAGGGEGAAAWVLYPFKPLIRLMPWIKPYMFGLPSQVEVEITLRCNKLCVLCEHTYWKEKAEELSLDDFKRITDQFPTLKWVNLTGEGDAFLNKDYLDMIDHLKKRDVAVYLVDSFDLLDETRARRILQAGVNGIWISWDAATKETYEKIKVGCDFDRSLNNIRTLIRLKKEMGSPIPELCFRYVINTMNVHEMPKYIELIASLGNREDLGDGTVVEFCGLLKFKEVEQYYLPDIPLDIYEATVKKAEELGVYVMFSHATPVLPALEHCVSWSEPYIMMKGYVMPCCAVLQTNDRDYLKKYSFGNLLEKPFDEIWNSKRYREFRRMICDPKGQVPILCANCRAFDVKPRKKLYGVNKEV